jgi:hypothetical protein
MNEIIIENVGYLFVTIFEPKLILRQRIRHFSRLTDEIHSLSAFYWSENAHVMMTLHVVENKKNTNINNDIFLNYMEFYCFFFVI